MPCQLIAQNVIPADHYFDGADPARWGGNILRNGAGVEVYEHTGQGEKHVRLLADDWREHVEGQSQVVFQDGNGTVRIS